MERSDHSCHLRDRQQTDESRSIGNKTGNKSRDLFFDSFSCGIRGQEGKERKGGRRRSFTTLCASICLIQIFLFMLLLPLLLYLHFFCVLVSFTVLAFSIKKKKKELFLVESLHFHLSHVSFCIIYYCGDCVSFLSFSLIFCFFVFALVFVSIFPSLNLFVFPSVSSVTLSPPHLSISI